MIKNEQKKTSKCKVGGGKHYLILYKTNGKFINVYEDDAWIINLLFGYKILDNKKCGFPNTVLNKVINTLEEVNISYQIITKNENPVVKDYKKTNKYKQFLDQAKTNMTMQENIDRITLKIKNCNEVELKKILESIDLCLK